MERTPAQRALALIDALPLAVRTADPPVGDLVRSAREWIACAGDGTAPHALAIKVLGNVLRALTVRPDPFAQAARTAVRESILQLTLEI
jgi:hypothetical protein